MAAPRYIITHGECLDGTVSGAMLGRVYPDAEIVAAHPREVREPGGWLEPLIEAGAILADLPYHPGCVGYFDHHLTNEPGEDYEGHWEIAPSAAEIIHAYYENTHDLADFDTVLSEVSDIDSGNITLETWNNPSSVMNLAHALKGNDATFSLLVAELLRRRQPSFVFSHQVVRENMQREEQRLRDYRARLPDITTIHNETLAIVRAEEFAFASSGYSVGSTFPDIDACIVVRRGGKGMSASFYNNNFKHKDAPMDLTILATRFDPRGGGHFNACGCGIADEPTLEEQIQGWIELWDQHTARA